MPYREPPDRVLTVSAAPFREMDVGMQVILYLPWYTRLWRWIKRVVLRRKLRPYELGTYTITEIISATQVRIDEGKGDGTIQRGEGLQCDEGEGT